jgi:hypothetical protein
MSWFYDQLTFFETKSIHPWLAIDSLADQYSSTVLHSTVARWLQRTEEVSQFLMAGVAGSRIASPAALIGRLLGCLCTVLSELSFVPKRAGGSLSTNALFATS